MLRVLLSTIKNLGLAPCPRCLIKKKDIPGVGTPADTRQRNKRRIDNEQRRKRVESARTLIFEKGSAITSKDVQKHLGRRSMVPTRVRIHSHGLQPTDTFTRTHSQIYF